MLLIASPSNDCKLRISVATPRHGIQEGRTLEVAADERDASRKGDWATERSARALQAVISN